LNEYYSDLDRYQGRYGNGWYRGRGYRRDDDYYYNGRSNNWWWGPFGWWNRSYYDR
jgi:hypothetical protein